MSYVFFMFVYWRFVSCILQTLLNYRRFVLSFLHTAYRRYALCILHTLHSGGLSRAFCTLCLITGDLSCVFCTIRIFALCNLHTFLSGDLSCVFCTLYLKGYLPYAVLTLCSQDIFHQKFVVLLPYKSASYIATSAVYTVPVIQDSITVSCISVQYHLSHMTPNLLLCAFIVCISMSSNFYNVICLLRNITVVLILVWPPAYTVVVV